MNVTMKRHYLHIMAVLSFLCIKNVEAQFVDLYTFSNTVASNPLPTLTLNKGVLYGFSQLSDGTIYSIHTDGTGLTNIFGFNGTDGYYPAGGLTPSITGDTLFGMTADGGPSYAYHVNGYGVIFSIRTDGSNYHKLHDFSDTDGENPPGSLTLLGHNLYGMTALGGKYGKGVLFLFIPMNRVQGFA